MPEVISWNHQKTRFSEATSSLEMAWRNSTTLMTFARKKPADVTGSVHVDMPLGRLGRGTFLLITMSPGHFNAQQRLNEIVELGDAMYDVFSPCYAYAILPGTPSIGTVAAPDKGLPGIGWVTWLGPEYDDIVSFARGNGIDVKVMRDGGRRILLPVHRSRGSWKVDKIEYARVMRTVDPRVFQAPVETVHLVGREEGIADAVVKIATRVALEKRNPPSPILPAFRCVERNGPRGM